MEIRIQRIKCDPARMPSRHPGCGSPYSDLHSELLGWRKAVDQRSAVAGAMSSCPQYPITVCFGLCIARGELSRQKLPFSQKAVSVLAMLKSALTGQSLCGRVIFPHSLRMSIFSSTSFQGNTDTQKNILIKL